MALATLFRGIALLTQPDVEAHAARAAVALSSGILLVHAALYFGGAALRTRWGLRSYFAGQTAAVFAFGLLAPPLPLALALYGALTAYAVRLLGGRWPAALVTTVAIAVFAVNTAIASNVYRAASVGLVLAVVGAVVHALSGARDGGAAQPDQAGDDMTSTILRVSAGGIASGLTPREVQVLRLAARGDRNHEIAEHLGISQRTVKAHLASVYGKLGVKTRAAATALATQRGLLS